MDINFQMRDIVHSVAVRFRQAFLPTVKKAYHLKVVNQPELDIKGIATKGAVYNISTSPKVIEEGLSAGLQLIYYLVADGYKIKTDVFELKICVPGEYEGHETSLPPGTYPVARMRTSPALQKYLRKNVLLEFSGFDKGESIIARATDEATGLVSEQMTIGNYLTILGRGLKIESDEKNKDKVGLFFRPKSGTAVKAPLVAVNEAKKLKVLVPSGLKKGTAYQITVETQSSPKNSGTILKNMRTIESNFTIVAA